MKKLNLQMFAGSLTVTVYKDSGITTATASPASSLAKGDTVELTITPASGYELDDVEVVSGGVTVDMDELEFTMDEADVVLNVKSKADNKYMIVENTFCCVNGSVTRLQRNMTLEYGSNGAIVGVSSNGTAITLSADIVNALIASGAIKKI